jgi:hypothetical protein
MVPVAKVAADRWQAHAGLSAAPHREMPDADNVHCAVRADHLFARDAVLEARLVDDARAGVRGEDAGGEFLAEFGEGRCYGVGGSGFGSGSGSGATPGRSAGIACGIAAALSRIVASFGLKGALRMRRSTAR